MVWYNYKLLNLIKKCNNDKNILNRRIESKRIEYNRLNEKVKNLKGQLRNLENKNLENTNCQMKNNELNETLNKTKDDYDAYIENCKSLETTCKSRNKTLSSLNDNLSSNNKTLSSKNNTLSSTNIELTQNYNKISDSNDILTSQNKELTDVNELQKNKLNFVKKDFITEQFTLKEDFKSEGVNIEFSSNNVNIEPSYRDTYTNYEFKKTYDNDYKLEITKKIEKADIYIYNLESEYKYSKYSNIEINKTNSPLTGFETIKQHLINNQTLTNNLPFKNPITDDVFTDDVFTEELVFLSIPYINTIQSEYMITQSLMEEINLEKNKILVINSKLNIAMKIYSKYVNFMYFTVGYIIAFLCIIYYTLNKYILYIGIIITILIFIIMNNVNVNVTESFNIITMNEIVNNKKIVRKILKDFKNYSQKDYDTIHSDLMKKTQKNNLIGILNEYNKNLFSFIYLLLILSIFSLILLQSEIDFIISCILTLILFIIITLRFFLNINKTNRNNFLKKYF